ncbi:winged helix-turn-helix transcriptional regulator [Thermorudis peleae]|uniref:winged helix-turn-helix transcriptional regulator n=1 Tax=Thermorudis peleae TaxID=1382356 RepID=UPI000571732C|nr:helix-turn-helix domain-containing protein [Thermorudis peleae]MBX6752616.1 helix-turn-helix transcriptional regulator [Thermorudis peleae]
MRRTHERTDCPIARAAQLLGDHWTLLIVRDLAQGCKRFHELQRSTGMSPTVLSDRLRHLEAAGLISRRQYMEIPPRVEYSLTEMGKAALPVIEQLRLFGETWLREDHSSVDSSHTDDS